MLSNMYSQSQENKLVALLQFLKETGEFIGWQGIKFVNNANKWYNFFDDFDIV